MPNSGDGLSGKLIGSNDFLASFDKDYIKKFNKPVDDLPFTGGGVMRTSNTPPCCLLQASSLVQDFFLIVSKQLSLFRFINKSGLNKRNKVSNIRPIALYPVISKIIKKLIKSCLIFFVFKFNILSLWQIGCLEEKSYRCDFLLLHNIYSTLNNNLGIETGFSDFSKVWLRKSWHFSKNTKFLWHFLRSL